MSKRYRVHENTSWQMACVFCLLLLVILAISNSSCADSYGGWPVRTLGGTTVSLVKNGYRDRYQSYLGPGKKYVEGGAYDAGKRGLTAILRENGYVLVDTGARYVYFPVSSISDAPDYDTTMVAYSTVTTTEVNPRFGPNENYQRVSLRLKSEYADWSVKDLWATFGGSYEVAEALEDRVISVHLQSGTPVKVFFEMNGWVYAEFEEELVGLLRAWIPATQVSGHNNTLQKKTATTIQTSTSAPQNTNLYNDNDLVFGFNLSVSEMNTKVGELYKDALEWNMSSVPKSLDSLPVVPANLLPLARKVEKIKPELVISGKKAVWISNADSIFEEDQWKEYSDECIGWTGTLDNVDMIKIDTNIYQSDASYAFDVRSVTHNRKWVIDDWEYRFHMSFFDRTNGFSDRTTGIYMYNERINVGMDWQIFSPSEEDHICLTIYFYSDDSKSIALEYDCNTGMLISPIVSVTQEPEILEESGKNTELEHYGQNNDVQVTEDSERYNRMYVESDGTLVISIWPTHGSEYATGELGSFELHAFFNDVKFTLEQCSFSVFSGSFTAKESEKSNEYTQVFFIRPNTEDITLLADQEITLKLKPIDLSDIGGKLFYLNFEFVSFYKNGEVATKYTQFIDGDIVFPDD